MGSGMAKGIGEPRPGERGQVNLGGRSADGSEGGACARLSQRPMWPRALQGQRNGLELERCVMASTPNASFLARECESCARDTHQCLIIQKRG